ncbi:MAG: transporter [Rubripirellula sp.]
MNGRCRLTFAALVCASLLGTESVATAGESGFFLEFMDDFCKPACRQRDPFEERIETERHDFTQSATTVGRHMMQVESGYSFFYRETSDETESSHTFPEMLLRVGITEDIEVRLRWNHAWKFIDEEENLIGSEDLRYSVKLQLTRQEESSWIPTSAIEIRGSAPTGSTFSTGDAEFSFDTIYQWELVEGLTVAGSTGFGTNGFGEFGLLPDPDFADYYNVWSQSAVVGKELGDLNTIYFEWYGIFSDGLEDDFATSILNIGVDHYITDNFVVDVRFGCGLNEDSDDFFSGIGGGFRF